MSSIEKSQHIAIISVVIVLITLMVGATDLHVPSLPAIGQALSASVSDVQLTVTLYLLGYGISPLIYGPLSDAYGRRGILIFGLMIAFIGSLFCMLAPTIGVLLLGRLIQGIGLGAGSAMIRAIFRDAFSGKILAKAGSYMGTASSLSLGVAPVVGGLVQQFLDWRVNFCIIAVGVVFVFICILKYLPETHHNKNTKAKNPVLWIKNYFELISSKAFVSSVLMAGLAFSGMIVYVTIAPFLMQKTLGLSPMSFGFLAIFIAVAQAVGFNVNTRILKRFSINQAIFTGVCMMLMSGLLLIVLSLFGLINVTSIIAVVVIYVIGTGFIYANAYAQAFTPFGHIIGFAAAMYGMLQTVIGGIASFIVALIPHYNAMAMGILFTIIAILSLLAFRVVVKCSKSNAD